LVEGVRERRDEVDEDGPKCAVPVARGGVDADLAAFCEPLLNSLDILFIRETNAGDRQERRGREKER